MSDQHQAPYEDQDSLETDFGAFFPRGHIMIAFDKREDAVKVREDLLTGGYDESDCKMYTPEEVAAGARENYQKSGWLAKVGTSAETVSKHWTAAEEGAYFLLLYAPNELDSDRAMNVVRRVDFRFAHRYHHFVIEELD